jgi:hypothetical protein
MNVTLYVDWTGGRLAFNGPATGTRYGWEATRDGQTVEIDEADVPELLKLTYSRGCHCTGGTGDNETKHYFLESAP